jgi:pyranose oxidase
MLTDYSLEGLPVSDTASFDVLIIGSGPVGCAFARIIAERRPETSILMVEAGPQLTPRPGSHVKNLADEDSRAKARAASQGPANLGDGVHKMVVGAGERPMARAGTHLANPDSTDGMPAAALSTCVGGMGAHWTCACPRPGDSERVSFIPEAELDAALDEAERLLSVTTTAFPDSLQGRAIQQGLGATYDDRLGEGRKIQIMPLACHPTADGRLEWSGGDTVLGPLIDPQSPLSRHFHLRSETLCMRVLHQGSQAVGAVLKDLRTSETYEVKARVVVVAADALRTPQVLWASGVRPTALGRYLNDQPQVLAAVTLKEEMLGRRNGAVDQPVFGKAARRSDIDPTTAVFWAPFADPAHPFHGQIMHLDVSPIGINAEVDPDNAPGVVALGWFCRKAEIRAEDRVVFDDSRLDVFGLPAMRIDYALTERDLAEVGRAKAEQLRAAAALGTLLPGDTSRLLPAGSSLHYQGSTRMGAVDDGTSVCNDRSLVWGFDNLFVGGNGVIPTATACNPTLTSVALAVRACDAILAQL